MSSIIQNNFRVSAARKFVERVGQAGNFVYAFVGKTTQWDDEVSPPVPVDHIQAEIDAYTDMMHLRRVIANDVYQCIKRYDWREGVVYSPYRSYSVLFDPANGPEPFYVMTDENNVYKCIGNAQGSPSLVKPTGRSANIFASRDGYLWKYIYTVTSELNKFVTPEYIPVKSVGSIGAKDYGIEYVEITNAGTGYTGSTIALAFSGSGTGAAGYATISNGSLTGVVITNRGSGYRDVTVTVAAPVSGTQATLQGVISPPGGHGSNPPRELGGHNVIIIARFVQDQDGIFTIDNDFRKIGLLENPLNYLNDSVLTAESLSQTHNLKFSSVVGPDFSPDEVVTGSISGVTAVVVDYDNSTQILRVCDATGEFHPGEEVETGTTSGLLDIGTGASGTAQSGGSISLTLESGAPSTIFETGFYTIVKITGGTGINQIRRIVEYNGSTKVCTLSDIWDPSLVPDSTSEYVLAHIKYPDIKIDSGEILYIGHKRPIIRADDQIEEIKVIVEF